MAINMNDLAKVAGEYEVRNPKRYSPMVPPQTLTEAVRFCTDHWTRRFPDSVDTYLRHLQEFVKWAHGHLRHPCMMEQIDQYVLARYRCWLENREKQGGGKLSGNSVQLKLNSLRAMFKVLIQLGYVKHNPMIHIETAQTRRERLKRAPFEELRLSFEDLQTLLSYPFEDEGYWGLRDKVLLHTLGFFGMRPVELTWIKPASFHKNTFSFERAKHNHIGAFWVHNEFRSWVDEMEYQYGISPGQSLFLGQYRTGITVKGIQNIVRKYGERIGVSGLTPKDFRATVETYLDQNCEAIDRDKFMGYKEYETARKYYVKVPKTVVQNTYFEWVMELKGK